MNTPLNRQLNVMVDLEEMRELARRLALALADEVAYHGDENSAEASLEVLAVARAQLDLVDEFDNIDSLKGERK